MESAPACLISERTSRRAGSTERRPERVLAMTGNTETMRAETVTARKPAPNQITRTGAMARANA